jgi:replication factor C subunit 2/4
MTEKLQTVTISKDRKLKLNSDKTASIIISKKTSCLTAALSRDLAESSNESLDVEEIFKGNDLIIVKKDKMTSKAKYIRDKNQTTWVDKYRPKTLKDIIGHDDVKNLLITSIEKGDLPHLLFHGGSGTGKTSTVMALVMQLYGPKRINEKVLELNASDENGINVVRDKIIKFANIVVGSADPKYPSPSFKIIILDEADSMTSEAQTALKKVMESTCEITRFVFICNYESKIIDAIKSRCADFRFNPIPDALMIKKLKTIAQDENMNVEDDVFQTITYICDGDARRSINTLQNIKYIPRDKNVPVSKADIYTITSFIEKSYFDRYWKDIISAKVIILNKLVIEITNTGYPMNYILQCIKDKVLESGMTQRQISNILMQIGKVERMITTGSDNYLQLLAVLSYINGIYKKIEVQTPCIY